MILRSNYLFTETQNVHVDVYEGTSSTEKAVLLGTIHYPYVGALACVTGSLEGVSLSTLAEYITVVVPPYMNGIIISFVFVLFLFY